MNKGFWATGGLIGIILTAFLGALFTALFESNKPQQLQPQITIQYINTPYPIPVPTFAPTPILLENIEPESESEIIPNDRDEEHYEENYGNKPEERKPQPEYPKWSSTKDDENENSYPQWQPPSIPEDEDEDENKHENENKGYVDKYSFINIKIFMEDAQKGDHKAIRELLSQTDISINIKDENGKTALIYAAKGGHDDTVKYLLQIGAEVDLQDNFGNTALIYAAIKGHNSVVKNLLEANADFTLEDNFGRTPLVLANMGRHDQTAKVLKLFGAKK